MVQDIPDLDELLLKLETLRLLGERENIEVQEIAKNIGIHEWEAVKLVEKLRENYLITWNKDRVVWLSGDNPAKIKPWGWNYVYKIVVGSTMLTSRHTPPWSIVVAEFQSRGYGRHGKRWISDLGGIWMTLKLETTPRAAQVLPMIVPVIICDFLGEKLGVKAGIKWPNDIMVKGKKLAGFLIEAEIILNKVHVYLGIGVNANNSVPLEQAVSLKGVLDKLIPRNSIIAYIAGVLSRVESLAADTSKIEARYLELLETLGKRVKVVVKDFTYTGVARGVTESGDLIVETDTGFHKFSSGEVFELRHLE